MTDDRDFRQRIVDWAHAEGLDRPKRKDAQKRKRPTFSDKLAAVLLLLSNADGSPMIPEGHRDSKDAIFSVPLDWDHIIALGLEGPDVFHNLRPLSRESGDHKRKTKADKKKMAHNNRLQKQREEKEAAATALAELGQAIVMRDAVVAALQIPGATITAFPKKPKRKSRLSNPTWKRKINGKTVRRDAA